MTVNRKYIRATLAAALTTAMPAAQAVYGYQRGGFEGRTPVVRVMSAGSERPRLTARGNWVTLSFLVQIWVLYADPDADWTEANAEDALDQLEYELAVYVEAHRSTNDWLAIDLEGRSRVEIVRYQGLPYLVEDVPITVKAT